MRHVHPHDVSMGVLSSNRRTATASGPPAAAAGGVTAATASDESMIPARFHKIPGAVDVNVGRASSSSNTHPQSRARDAATTASTTTAGDAEMPARFHKIPGTIIDIPRPVHTTTGCSLRVLGCQPRSCTPPTFHFVHGVHNMRTYPFLSKLYLAFVWLHAATHPTSSRRRQRECVGTTHWCTISPSSAACEQQASCGTSCCNRRL